MNLKYFENLAIFLAGCASCQYSCSYFLHVVGGDSRNGDHIQEHIMKISYGQGDEAQPPAAKEAKRGMILPFKPLAISFSDIKYYVDMPPVCPPS